MERPCAAVSRRSLVLSTNFSRSFLPKILPRIPPPEGSDSSELFWTRASLNASFTGAVDGAAAAGAAGFGWSAAAVLGGVTVRGAGAVGGRTVGSAMLELSHAARVLFVTRT